MKRKARKAKEKDVYSENPLKLPCHNLPEMCRKYDLFYCQGGKDEFVIKRRKKKEKRKKKKKKEKEERISLF